MSKTKFVLGAIVGAVVGAGAALLTAPKSGKETREDLKRKASDLKDEVRAQAGKVVGAAQKVSETTKAGSRRVAREVADTVEKAAKDVEKRLK